MAHDPSLGESVQDEMARGQWPASELRRIAFQIERWARHEDVMPPGLPDAKELREIANEVERLTPNDAFGPPGMMGG